MASTSVSKTVEPIGTRTPCRGEARAVEEQPRTGGTHALSATRRSPAGVRCRRFPAPSCRRGRGAACDANAAVDSFRVERSRRSSPHVDTLVRVRGLPHKARDRIGSAQALYDHSGGRRASATQSLRPCPDFVPPRRWLAAGTLHRGGTPVRTRSAPVCPARQARVRMRFRRFAARQQAPGFHSIALLVLCSRHDGPSDRSRARCTLSRGLSPG